MRFVQFIIKLAGHFPNKSIIRKLYNKRRVTFYSKRAFSAKQIEEAETNQEKKRELLSLYARHYPQKFASIKDLIENQLMLTPAYRERQDDQPLKEDIMFCELAYGFHPDEFIYYELEEKTAEQRRQFVSGRELMECVYRMNDRIDISTFNDKAKTYKQFGKYYDREAVIVETREDYQNYCDFITKHSIFVKKKTNEAMGRTVELVDLQKGKINADAFFNDLISNGKFLLEECIIQDPEMAVFNQSSVNTIRCITFLTKKGVSVPYCFMKCGRKGSFVDNGGAGGILIGIDPETGKLNTDGFDEFHTRYPVHPDFNIQFDGYQLPKFEQAMELAKGLSSQYPSVQFIGWDFAYTKGYWIVVEGNGMSQLVGPQLTYERRVKQEVASIMKEMDLIVE